MSLCVIRFWNSDHLHTRINVYNYVIQLFNELYQECMKLLARNSPLLYSDQRYFGSYKFGHIYLTCLLFIIPSGQFVINTKDERITIPSKSIPVSDYDVE